MCRSAAEGSFVFRKLGGGQLVLGRGQGSVVVAVISVGPMQPPVDQVIDVVAMRNGLVSAALAVCMRGIASGGTGMARWVRFVNRDHVLVDMVLVEVVQVTIVDVVDVIGVTHGRVSATGSVPVGMVALMDVVGHELTLGHLAALRKRPTRIQFWRGRRAPVAPAAPDTAARVHTTAIISATRQPVLRLSSRL